MAWGTTLAKLSGRSDICFGHVLAGRNLPLDDTEDAVGPYLNFLPCRIQMLEEELHDTLKEVQQMLFESWATVQIP